MPQDAAMEAAGVAPLFVADTFGIMDFFELFGIGSGFGFATGAIMTMLSWGLMRSFRMFRSAMRDGTFYM